MNGEKTTSPTSFVDSNLWLYALTHSKTGKEEVKGKRAQEVILSARHAVSTQVVAEVSTNLLRKSIASESEIAELVDDFYREHTVVSIDQQTFRNGSALRIRYSFSFWDSLIVASALQSGAQILYTEDMQHGFVVDGRLRIVNPFRQE